MFTVVPTPMSEVRAFLAPHAALLPDIWDQLPLTTSTVNAEQRPSIQLSAHDISEEEEAEVFDYAGMSMAAAPIGLTIDLQPRMLGDDPRERILLFSLDGFYAHLKQTAAEIIALYEQSGSFQEFLRVRGNELTPKEYLCAGLADCVAYCKAENEALTIRW